MDREAMEQELWRLRSVEIDLERALEESESLRKRTEMAEAIAKDHKAAEDSLRREISMFKNNIANAEKEREQAIKEREEAVRERNWAVKKLQEYHEADYMHQTYDFKVVDKMPERKGKNWRLSR